jgi:hypothetical protein
MAPKPKEEKKRPPIAPLSGSESNLTPGMFPRRRGNCYAFALDLKSRNLNKKLQPGELAGANGDATASCSELRSLVNRDSEKLNIRPSKAETKCPRGYYKIAGVVDPGDDYHFMRQVRSITFRTRKGDTKASVAAQFDVPASSVRFSKGTATVTRKTSGFWAHKRGLATGAIYQDARGRVIKDPRNANMNYGNLDYSRFCGFYCVRARSSKEASKNSSKMSAKKK